MQEFKNKHWITPPSLSGDKSDDCVCFITPVYNRRSLLPRAMASVKAQTHKNIEYIIVNDGSTQEVDDIIFPFMESVPFPVLYIKKENGGVHTARNAAIARARAKFTLFLDDDDEYVPTAAEIFVKAFNSIPLDRLTDIRGVVAHDSLPNGTPLATPFPPDVNSHAAKLAWHKAKAQSKGHHTAIVLTKVLQQNPWPEPEGVKFVTESVVWNKLLDNYREWCINECLRIYHTETEVSLCKPTKSTQWCIDNIFNRQYLLNHPALNQPLKRRVTDVLVYIICTSHLQGKRQLPHFPWMTGLKGLKNNFLLTLLTPAVRLAMPILRKKLRLV